MPWKTRGLRIGLCGLFVVLSSVAIAADAVPPADPAGAIEIRVIDGSSKTPIADAAIGGTINRKVTVGKTGPEGAYRLAIPAGMRDTVMVTVTKQGFVPMRWTWRKTTSEELPSTMPFELEKTSPIGGIVRDEQDNPIAGATVSLVLPSSGNRQPRAWLANSNAKTNAEGRWHFDNMPASATDIWIRLSHSDFISDDIYNTTPRPPIEQLRDRTGVMVMRRGVALSGRVLDDRDNPIAGAAVRQGHDRFGTNHPTTKTDDKGEFHFPQARSGEIVLTVQAPGYAPDVRDVTVAGDPVESIEFLLRPGRTVRGRVIDAEGNPVAGAFVAADTWRGKRSLEWRVNTDNDGRFTWNEAPEDEVLLDLGKQGFMSVRHFSLKGTDEDVTITLNRPLEVTGHVVDDTTGKPLAEFQLIKGIIFPNSNQPSWQRREPSRGVGGDFKLSFTEPYERFLVRVEALGYGPEVSQPFKSSDGNQTVEFRLKPAANIAGVVRDAQGKPLANQEVSIVVGQLGVQVTRGKIITDPSGTKTTAEDGSFNFPPQTEPYLLVVASEQGFAAVPQISFESDHQIKLAPWGRLQGRVRVGKLGPNGHLSVYGRAEHVDGLPRMHISETATADADGRYVFDRLAPGPAYLALTDGGRRWGNGMTSISTLRGIEVEIEAGTTVTADLIAEGRTVTGRIVNEDGSPPASSEPTQANIRLYNAFANLPFPEGWADMTRKEKIDWYQRFSESPEGQGFLLQQRLNDNRNYSAPIDGQGRFSIEAVPPGSYRLYANFRVNNRMNHIRGHVQHDFSVPEPPDNASDEPVDLGEITVTNE